MNIHNELMKQYPESTHGRKGISHSLLKGIDIYASWLQNRVSLDNYMESVSKDTPTFALGKAVEAWLAGGEYTGKLTPEPKRKLSLIQSRLERYHAPLLKMLRHGTTRYHRKLSANFVTNDGDEATLFGELDFIVPNLVVNEFLGTDFDEDKYMIFDVKTTSNFDWFARDIEKYQYIQQLAIYRNLCEYNSIPVDRELPNFSENTQAFIVAIDTTLCGNMKLYKIDGEFLGSDVFSSKVSALAKILDLNANQTVNTESLYEPSTYIYSPF